MAIKAIIFDCFGVLVTSGREMLYRDFSDKYQEIFDIGKQADYGMISRQDYNEAVAQITGLTPGQVEGYWRRTMRDEKMISWVSELKNQGELKVALLSNVGYGLMEEYLPDDERGTLFDEEILSSKEGIIKPSPEIYEIMAMRLGLDTSECVMIDDRLSNIEGAERAGMKGIVFTSMSQVKADLTRLTEEWDA